MTAKCIVEVRSWSFHELPPSQNMTLHLCTRKQGYVKLNGHVVLQSAQCSEQERIGTSVVQIDPATCTKLSNDTFKTYSTTGAAESTRLDDYIRNAPAGAIIAAFTSNSAQALDNAKDTLKSELGVDLNNFMLDGHRGSFAFIAQKGFVSKAIVVKKPDTDKSHIHPANITAALSAGLCKLLLSIDTR